MHTLIVMVWSINALKFLFNSSGVSHLPTILIAVVSFVAIIIISAIIIIIIIIFVFVCWKRKGRA